jgi:formate dehydrogenase assembly factor FdhD
MRSPTWFGVEMLASRQAATENPVNAAELRKIEWIFRAREAQYILTSSP